MQNLPWKLEERKIEIRDSPDQIRWGYRTPGQFNVKEAAELASGAAYFPSEKKWCSLWGLGHWPKITLFLWILMRGRIITWENLKRRGMVGPSMCVMCQKVEETTSHLLQECDWAAEIWEKGETLFRRPRLRETPIQNMVEMWSDKPFKNSILKRIWEIFPGFVLWETWKERNSQIFEGRTQSLEEAWTLVQAHTKETL